MIGLDEKFGRELTRTWLNETRRAKSERKFPFRINEEDIKTKDNPFRQAPSFGNAKPDIKPLGFILDCNIADENLYKEILMGRKVENGRLVSINSKLYILETPTYSEILFGRKQTLYPVPEEMLRHFLPRLDRL